MTCGDNVGRCQKVPQRPSSVGGLDMQCSVHRPAVGTGGKLVRFQFEQCQFPSGGSTRRRRGRTIGTLLLGAGALLLLAYALFGEQVSRRTIPAPAVKAASARN
jgi:hypothetical protein